MKKATAFALRWFDVRSKGEYHQWIDACPTHPTLDDDKRDNQKIQRHRGTTMTRSPTMPRLPTDRRMR